MRTGRNQIPIPQMPLPGKSNWTMSKLPRRHILTLLLASFGSRHRLKSNRLICWPRQETTFAYGHFRIRSQCKALTQSLAL
jgi:hypothetical protein